ncbi:MAG: TetR/AcrR family transcriptional regulator [Pseudomonadota bacterium]
MSKKAITRQKIIQAAIEVFGKNGFQNSGISEIARKADVADGTIYQYFKNKEDLFFAIPAEKTKEFCLELELHLQGITGSVNKMRKFIWYYLYFFQENPEYARTLMLEMRVSKGFTKSRTYSSLREFTTKALDIIKEGQEEGAIRKDVNVYLIRELLLGILEHMVTRWLVRGEDYDLMQYYREATELVIHGIADPG